MRTAIVTGATGFIGSALTKELSYSGVQVYAVDLNQEKLSVLSQLPGVTIVCAGIGDPKMDTSKLPIGADVMYHCAFVGGFGSEALRDYDLQLRNAKLACDATALALRLSVHKFVLASTVNTVELRSFIGNENFIPRNTCIYSTGKLAAELIGKTLARSGGMAFCTALVAMPYGEGNGARTLPNIVMEQLMTGVRPKLIKGENLYDLVCIDDVAGALCAIGEKGATFRDYYVGHRKLGTFKSWISRMRDVLAPGAELGFGEYPDAPALDYGKIDLELLYRDTGFVCDTDFEMSIRATAEWLLSQKQEHGTVKFSGGGVTNSFDSVPYRCVLPPRSTSVLEWRCAA